MVIRFIILNKHFSPQGYMIYQEMYLPIFLLKYIPKHEIKMNHFNSSLFIRND